MANHNEHRQKQEKMVDDHNSWQSGEPIKVPSIMT